MSYPFFINNFDRVKNFREEYPSVGKIFEYPVSFWYGSRKGKNVKYLDKGVRRLLQRAYPALPILVIYNFPNRDLGQYSKGGAKCEDSYLQFISSFCDGLGDSDPIVIYEPDALAHTDKMQSAERERRLSLIKTALETLSERTQARIYADIGHSNWLDLNAAQGLLDAVMNPNIRGFALNTSNYRTTTESVEFGQKLCELRPQDHFVIDTSRNGNGPYGNEWCNPPGRAIGHPPTTDTGIEQCDAFLWIKVPGESDGKKNGGLRAGRFWPEMAEKLISATPYMN